MFIPISTSSLFSFQDKAGSSTTVSVRPSVRRPSFFSKAGVVHRFSYTPGAEGYVPSLSPDFALSLSDTTGAMTETLAKLSVGAVVENIDQVTAALLRQHCDHLCLLTDGFHPHRRQLMGHLLAAFLLRLAPFIATPSEQPGRGEIRASYVELIERYHALMHAEVGKLGFSAGGGTGVPIIATLVADLGCSAHVLNQACRQVTGQGAREILQDALAMQASRLLLFTRLSIKEVSYALGYSHPSHFLRFFKRHRQATPEEFRKTYGQS